MAYDLGLLDKSPLDGDEPPERALARSLTLARKAEALGYSRLWLAEHHNNAAVAGSAPEILAAHLLAQTSRIRIGSGGVMLNHYSPYKVAEVFRLLAALAPGRVDLGVGKAPGGLPEASRALRLTAEEGAPAFAEKLAALSRHLDDDPQASLRAYPAAATAPRRFLLGASEESAELAARHGWTLVYAAHIDGDEARIRSVFAAWRAAGGEGPPLLALSAVAAAGRAEAADLAGDLTRWRLILPGRQSVNLGSREGAERYAAEIGATDWRIEVRKPQALFGTAEEIHDRLEAISRAHGVREFILDCPVSAAEARLDSVSLLGEARRALSPALS